MCCVFLLSICCLPCTDLPGQGHNIQKDERLPKRLRHGGDLSDVFCMVKATMADTLLCQPPLLVFPEAFSHLTAKFFEEVNSTSKVVPLSVDSDRGEELAAFAHALQSEFPHMKRAAEYYYSLINPDRPRRPYAQLAFIEAGPSATTNLSSVELGQPLIPPKPHHLQVVFHTK